VADLSEGFAPAFPAFAHGHREPVDVLVVGAGFGNGHNQSARAVGEAFAHDWPEMRVKIIDYLAWFPPGLGPLTAKSYVAMTKYWPTAYGLLHNLSGYLAPRPAWNDVVGAVGAELFRTTLTVDRPRLLVVTHPLPATVVHRWRQQGVPTPPTVVVVTDYSPHPQWLQPSLDAYCVPDGLARRQLLAAGVERSRVVETGIPLRQAFWQPPSRAASGPRVPTVLFLGSALGGLGGVTAACRRLVMALGHARLVVVTGRDRLVYSRLAQLAERLGPERLEVHSAVPSIAPLLTEADVLVTKAGGISLSEGLAMALPIVVYRPIPGHEAANAAWLEEQGAALVTRRPDEVVMAVRDVLANPERRRRMAARARALGRPEAARMVVRVARNLLDPP
jgi:processive 1,2-diacylglycerol beta-glucosyltransferase